MSPSLCARNGISYHCWVKPSERRWIASRLNLADRDALISYHQNLRYTYAQLLDQVNSARAASLRSVSGAGDRVGVWSANVAEWVITQYAAAKAGAILVNINPAYRSRELESRAEPGGRQCSGHGTQLP